MSTIDRLYLSVIRGTPLFIVKLFCCVFWLSSSLHQKQKKTPTNPAFHVNSCTGRMESLPFPSGKGNIDSVCKMEAELRR